MTSSKQADIDVREPIIAQAAPYKGVMRLDIRHHYITREGDFKPSQKGVNLALDRSNLAELMFTILVVGCETLGLDKEVFLDEVGAKLHANEGDA